MENPGQTADRRRDAEALLAHTGWMRSLALQLARDSAGAEDLVQDTLVAALERRAAAGPGLGAWLSGVLRNMARGRFRSAGRRRRRELLAARPEATPSAADIVERADLHKCLVEAVLRLEEPYVSAVLLRYFDGLRPVDIARAKGVPESTVRTWLARGMEKLRRSLQPTDARGREAWLSGLIVLAGVPAPKPSAGVGAGSSIALGGATVKVKVVLVASLLACAVLLVTGVVSIPKPDAGAGRQRIPERLVTDDSKQAELGQLEEARRERDRLRERVAELEAGLRSREAGDRKEARDPEETKDVPPEIQTALQSWSALLGDPERVWDQLHDEGDIEKMEEFTSTVGTLIPWKLANEELSEADREKLERLLDLNGFREGYVKFAKGDSAAAGAALGKHIEDLDRKEAELARAGRTLDKVASIYRDMRSKDVLRFLRERAGRPPAAELDLGEGWITDKRVFLGESQGKVVAILFRRAGDKRAASASFLTGLSRELTRSAGVELVTIGWFLNTETLDEARTKLKEDLAAIGYEGPAGVDPDSSGHALFRSWQATVGTATFMIVDREGHLAWYMPDPRGQDVRLVSRILERIAGGQ